MMLRICIAALGLLFSVAVPSISAEEPGPISKVTDVSLMVHSSPFTAGKNSNFEFRNSKLTVIGPRTSDIGRPVLASQHPGLKPITPADRGEGTPPEKRHRPGELDCSNCHVGKHQGVLQMYLGTGGRGTPMIPSHMFQVRVECIACHIVPKEAEQAVGIVGQTFRPTEQACLNCHGEKYRGMLTRWGDTLKRMREALAPKLAGAKEALAKAVPETVTFAKQKVPHGRHVAEFGAVCTNCHSAEVHKAVTATSATCRSCHHSPQNERCESCHRSQAAFYRGETKTDLVVIEPNVMAAAVSCTGCHDFTKKHSRKVVGQKCLACHDPGYLAFMEEWTRGLDASVADTAKVLQRAEAALGKSRGAEAKGSAAEGLVKEARAALDLVKGARGVHNPTAAEALLGVARRKAEEAMAQVAKP